MSKERTNQKRKYYEEYYDDKDGHYLFYLGESITDRYFMGEGTFSKVVECWDRKERAYCAMKIIRSIEKYTDSAEIEIDILLNINSKRDKRTHIIELKDHFFYRKHMCLVFPKLGLSLYDFLKRNHFKGFSIDHVKHIAYQVFESLSFLMDIYLIHTDLKPENILLKNSDYYKEGDNIIPKYTDINLIDFGSSVYDNDYHTRIISTRHYRAPEVILEIGWSFPADIWSVGCILVELYHGNVIFQTHENREHLAMIEKSIAKIPEKMIEKCEIKHYFKDKKLNWPEIATNEISIKDVNAQLEISKLLNPQLSKENQLFSDLCMKCLEIDPEKRIKAKEALLHPFFSTYLESITKI